MATENNDSLAPDEMYLMLQADMISIKQQEQVLQTEIEEIANKFHKLLEACGIDSDSESGTMAPPSTPPSFMNSPGSLSHVTRLQAQTLMNSGCLNYTTLSDSSDVDESRLSFSHATDTVLGSLMNMSDGLPTKASALSSKTLVVDSNSNYIGSPRGEMNDNTSVIEAFKYLDKTPPSLSSSITSPSSGSNSHCISSSDGYPKSDETTDNQIECYDLEREFMSQLQYCSDSILEPQRKINVMVSHLGGVVQEDSPCEVSESILTRHVEGKESSPEKPVFIKLPVLNPLKPIVFASSSGSGYRSSPASCHQCTNREHSQRHRYRNSGKKSTSKPLASSTMLENSFSSSSSGHAIHHAVSLIPRASSILIYESESSIGSGHRNRTSGSNPRACSTMLNECFLSSGSTGSSSNKHRSSSVPRANSTMIHDTELPVTVPCGAESTTSLMTQSETYKNIDNDCDSVITWSLHDGEIGSDKDINLEESYMKMIARSQTNTSCKQPLLPAKHCRSESISSRDSDFGNVCQDYRLHQLLGEACSKTIHASMLTINATDDTCQKQSAESVCDEISCGTPKSNNVPRSGTKVKFHDKSSGSSSMEAYRTSLPDLTSLCTPNNTDDHCLYGSCSCGSDNDTTAMCDRPEVQGKSSSSNDNQGASQGSANIDSILTDSPNSVSSSGIHAPHNSPGTNASSSSKVSCSTSSETRSSDSNINTRSPRVTLLPRVSQVPLNSPKVQNVDTNVGTQKTIFKVPKQTLPLKHLFQFRGNKTKTSEKKFKSVKSEPAAVSSSELHSRRKLFPPAATASPQTEAKIMDKKAVMRKFKLFSDSFRQKDMAGPSQIQTLANL